jgi:23S rRNA (guanosine2251-2'-O)-methyltransferase
MPAARCPYGACAAVFDVADGQRTASCLACGREVRPRWVHHEVTLEARRRDPHTWRWPQMGPSSVVVLLEDIRSRWNVGSLFRTADGLGLAHVFVCGITAVPGHPSIHDTALGAEEVVPWSYHPHAFEVLEHPAAAQLTWVALERTPGAADLGQLQLAHGPVGLVVGNEPAGVSPELLRACQHVVEIPMQGIKNSLNVAVAAGIGLYAVRRALAGLAP